MKKSSSTNIKFVASIVVLVAIAVVVIFAIVSVELSRSPRPSSVEQEMLDAGNDSSMHDMENDDSVQRTEEEMQQENAIVENERLEQKHSELVDAMEQ